MYNGEPYFLTDDHLRHHLPPHLFQCQYYGLVLTVPRAIVSFSVWWSLSSHSTLFRPDDDVTPCRNSLSVFYSSFWSNATISGYSPYSFVSICFGFKWITPHIWITTLIIFKFPTHLLVYQPSPPPCPSFIFSISDLWIMKSDYSP